MVRCFVRVLLRVRVVSDFFFHRKIVVVEVVEALRVNRYILQFSIPLGLPGAYHLIKQFLFYL